MIRINNLSFNYQADKPVLSDINLEIKQGDLFGLIGPNGAGKTTLMSLLCGILSPQNKSDISINDRPLSDALASKIIKLSYIPQDYAFYPNLSALENLDFFSGIQNLRGEYRKERINACLAFCQIGHVKNQRASTFSGGLKRRLNMAIGLLDNPDIIIFDEPTVSIDPQSRAFILEQIKLLHDQGKTIIYASHYMEEIEQLCNTIAIIDHGEILLQDDLAILKAREEQELSVRCILNEAQRKAILAMNNASINDSGISFAGITSLSGINRVTQQLEILNVDVQQLSYASTNLEQLFLQLTSKKLRD